MGEALQPAFQGCQGVGILPLLEGVGILRILRFLLRDARGPAHPRLPRLSYMGSGILGVIPSAKNHLGSTWISPQSESSRGPRSVSRHQHLPLQRNPPAPTSGLPPGYLSRTPLLPRGGRGLRRGPPTSHRPETLPHPASRSRRHRYGSRAWAV